MNASENEGMNPVLPGLMSQNVMSGSFKPGMNQTMPGMNQVMPGMNQNMPGMNQVMPVMNQVMPGVNQGMQKDGNRMNRSNRQGYGN